MTTDTRVYFIRCAATGMVKIGVSDDPRARLSSLQTGSSQPLDLVAEMPGDERYEAAIHSAFADCRCKGEWFVERGRLAQFIALLPAYSTEQPRPRRRTRAPQIVDREAIDRAYTEVLAILGDIVRRIGIDEFAAVAGTTRSFVARSLVADSGISFRLPWLCALLIVATPAESSRVLLALCRVANVAPATLGLEIEES
jgi:hypothetical protein